VGAIVGALATLLVGILVQRIDRSRYSATLEVVNQWVKDRYAQVNYFEGEFAALSHGIDHVSGTRSNDWSIDRDTYFDISIKRCHDMRERARANVGTVGHPYVCAVEEFTDAARALLVELKEHDGYYRGISDERAQKLDVFVSSYHQARDHMAHVTRQLMKEKLPRALRG
jgi:hypothetical protein